MTDEKTEASTETTESTDQPAPEAAPSDAVDAPDDVSAEAVDEATPVEENAADGPADGPADEPADEPAEEQAAERPGFTVGVVGRKSGMTRVFTDEGVSIPVTVVEVEPNTVTQVKTEQTDGYSAIQVTTGHKKANRVSKPLAGHYAKAGTEAGRGLWEFRTESDLGLSPGSAIGVDQFEEGQKVDVSGTSKGKGFAGVIKRWNFSGQDNSHGNSISHRAPGSIGQCQTPGRVFKGKKMAGQLGNVHVTTQNLEVVRVDTDRNLLLIKGAVPGPAGGDVYILPAVKA